jgi:hypothetical protein
VKQEQTTDVEVIPVQNVVAVKSEVQEEVAATSGQGRLTRVRPAVVDADQLVSVTCKLCSKILFEPVGLRTCEHNFCGACLSDVFLRAGNNAVRITILLSSSVLFLTSLTA